MNPLQKTQSCRALEKKNNNNRPRANACSTFPPTNEAQGMHVALQSSRNQGTELFSSTKIPQLSVVIFLSPLYSNPDKLQKKNQPPRSKAQRLTICAQSGRVLPLALCIATMVPHMTEDAELTRGEDRLIPKPGYTVGEPRPWHENKRARTHANTEHNL